MADLTFGEVDWNAGDSGGGSSASDFMRLDQGENVVRVMGNPTQFYVHWLTCTDNSKKKVVSPIDSPELVKRLEDGGFRRQARWLVKVLDRSDGKFKALEIGAQIYNGIRALYNNNKWGKVTSYDLSVMRGSPGQQPLYSVTPNPKEELESSMKTAWVEFNDRMNFDKIISPTAPEEICEMLGWQMSDVESDVASDSEAGSSDEDFEFDFE